MRTILAGLIPRKWARCSQVSQLVVWGKQTIQLWSIESSYVVWNDYGIDEVLGSVTCSLARTVHLFVGSALLA